jgi:hypothetical protein
LSLEVCHPAVAFQALLVAPVALGLLLGVKLYARELLEDAVDWGLWKMLLMWFFAFISD